MNDSLVFMGSPPFAATILEALCKRVGAPSLVVTQPPRPTGRGQLITPTAVENVARKLGIQVLSTSDANASLVIQSLRQIRPKLILVAAFGQIFGEELLKVPSLYCLNVHASLLPKYRGAAPIQMAILSGEKKTGITIQKMSNALDAGDVLLQREIEILHSETSEELQSRMATLGGSCLVEALELSLAGKAVFTPQEHTLASFAPKIKKELAFINWASPSEQIYNAIRAFQPWPTAHTRLGNNVLKLYRAEIKDRVSSSPGNILTDSKSHLDVVCGDRRALSLTELQLENRKRIDVREFLKAYRGFFPFQRMG